MALTERFLFILSAINQTLVALLYEVCRNVSRFLIGVRDWQAAQSSGPSQNVGDALQGYSIHFEANTSNYHHDVKDRVFQWLYRPNGVMNHCRYSFK